MGISEGHAVFGAAAVLAETVGAVLVILGFKTRPAAFSVFLTMVVAAAMHVGKDDGWSKVSQLAVPMNLEYFVNRCAWTV